MNEEETSKRLLIVNIARTWLGTPFHDHASVKGAGVDCGQLLRMVYFEAGLLPMIDVPHYSPQWHLHHEEEIYLKMVGSYGIEVESPLPGDTAMFKTGKCFGHGGIVSEWPVIIHANAAARCVELHDVSKSALGAREQKFFSPYPRD